MSISRKITVFAEKHKKLYIVFAVLAAMTAVFIFTNSMRNGNESKEQSDFFADILKALFIYDYDTIAFWVRKAAHFTEFMMFSVFFSLALLFKEPKKFYRRIIYVLFFGLLAACCDEYIQIFSEGRSSGVGDVFIDFFGVGTGVIICSVAYEILKRRINGRK